MSNVKTYRVAAAWFDADVAIVTGEPCQLTPDLVETLGGEGRCASASAGVEV